MSRKLILVVLGALAVVAVVAARRRARTPAPVEASSREVREGNGRDAGANDSLRVFVEAGERLREDSQPTS
jgi:hypothetical protein